MGVFADGKLYKLSDKEAALKHLGYEVVVTGTMTDDGGIQVASIEKAEKTEETEETEETKEG